MKRIWNGLIVVAVLLAWFWLESRHQARHLEVERAVRVLQAGAR